MGRGFFLFLPDSNNPKSRQILLDEFEAQSPQRNGSPRPRMGISRHPRTKNHASSTMHWSVPITPRRSRSSLFRFAYISGKSAAKLRGTSECDLPQVAHIQVVSLSSIGIDLGSSIMYVDILDISAAIWNSRQLCRSVCT
jgi:hypothetical protein